MKTYALPAVLACCIGTLAGGSWSATSVASVDDSASVEAESNGAANGSGVAGAVGAVIRERETDDSDDAAPRKTSRPPFTISKETTYITEPLTEAGYPDYIQHFNDLMSEGVTPENNAEVLLRQAMGWGELPEASADLYFAMLGIETLPKEGDYYVPFYGSPYDDETSFLETLAAERNLSPEQVQALNDAWDEAVSTPFTADDRPEIAKWLEVNRKPLELIVEASRRPKLYTPWITGDENPMMIAILLPTVQEQRAAVRALSIRAMLRVGEGDTRGALDDALTIHRLARLSGQGLTLINGLVAIACDQIGNEAELVIVRSGKLTKAQIAAYLEARGKLAPLPKFRDLIDRSERCMGLDCVGVITRGGPNALNQIGGLMGDESETGGLADFIGKAMMRTAIDWDTVLTGLNASYDRMVSAMDKPTYAERVEAFAEFEEYLQSKIDQAQRPQSVLAQFFGAGLTPKTIGEQMEAILTSLLLPAVGSAYNAEVRGKTMFELTVASFALEAYRLDHGQYPGELAALKPEYVDALPDDHFADGLPIYKLSPAGDGYLLYSVGVNRKDDGGENNQYTFNPDEPYDSTAGPTDDWTVRMPAAD